MFRKKAWYLYYHWTRWESNYAKLHLYTAFDEMLSYVEIVVQKYA